MNKRISNTKKKTLLTKYFFETYDGVIEKKKIKEDMIYQLEKDRASEYYEMIKNNIDKKSKILDFGSGFGGFVIFLNQMNFNAFGVENCKKSFQISKLSWYEKFKTKPKIFLVNSKLPFKDNTFDIITLWNVVEHINNFDFYFREISRILKKGGKIYILAPNYLCFRNEAHYHVPWIPFLSKNLYLKFLDLIGKNPDFFNEHVFPITKIDLIKKIRNQNLLVEIPYLDKLNNPSKIGRYWVKKIVEISKKFRVQRILTPLIKFKFYWPFSKTIFLLVRK